MADHPIQGKDLRGCVIPDALSYAQKVGRAQRLALKEGRDPVREIIAAVDGFLLLTGRVKEDTEWRNEGGFTLRSIEIEGEDEYSGSSFKIWFKNENIICRLDGEVLVTVPDLICVVEAKSGHPITNPFCKKGMKVSVLGFRAPEVSRTKRGLSILNPRFFGFDVDWVRDKSKNLSSFS